MPHRLERKPRFCIAGFTERRRMDVAEQIARHYNLPLPWNEDLPAVDRQASLLDIFLQHRDAFDRMFSRTAAMMSTGGVSPVSPLDLAFAVLQAQMRYDSDNPAQAACDAFIADCLHFMRFFEKAYVFLPSDRISNLNRLEDAVLYGLAKRSEIADRVVLVTNANFKQVLEGQNDGTK